MSGFVIRVATENGLWNLSEEVGPELEGRDVRWFHEEAGTGWAIVGEHQLWERASGGDWQQVAAAEGLTLRCLLPIPGGVLVGTSEAHLLRHGREGFEPVASFEFAEGREEWFTPWGGPPDVRSMAVDADGTLYVNVHVGGILRSVDDGTRWEPTIDLEADVHEVVTVAGRAGVLWAATARGLAASRDAGATWSFQTAGLDATYCRAVALAGDTLMLSASKGPGGGDSALYRRVDSGERFERCGRGLPDAFSTNIDTGCLAASDRAITFGTQDGRVYVSEDRGASWRMAREGMPRVRRVLHVAV